MRKNRYISTFQDIPIPPQSDIKWISHMMIAQIKVFCQKFINLIMRKKVAKVSRQFHLSPKPIITFDNKQYGQNLLQTLPRKLCSPDSFSRHAALLRLSAAQAGTFSLANNQILQQIRMLAVHRRPLPLSGSNALWISLDYNKPQDYQVFTDPEILEGEGLVERQEESISFPLITFSIKRYDSVAVRFRGQKGKEEKRLKGPIAWAFQQGLQQLNGTVPLDWRVNHGNFRFTSEALPHFPKSSAVLEEYSRDLKRVFEEYPELIEQEDSFAGGRIEKGGMDEPLPFENDYYRRLTKHYEREMSLLQQRLQGGQQMRQLRDTPVDVQIIKK